MGESGPIAFAPCPWFSFSTRGEACLTAQSRRRGKSRSIAKHRACQSMSQHVRAYVRARACQSTGRCKITEHRAQSMPEHGASLLTLHGAHATHSIKNVHQPGSTSLSSDFLPFLALMLAGELVLVRTGDEMVQTHRDNGKWGATFDEGFGRHCKPKKSDVHWCRHTGRVCRCISKDEADAGLANDFATLQMTGWVVWG
jgi:hypothetical protein